MDELERRLRRHVETLAAVPRPPGSAAHSRARAYAREHLEQADFTVRDDPFPGGPTGQGINLLTQPWPGRPELPLVVIGAHYDSLPQTPGADDNASAVAALLELAAWFGPDADERPCSVRLQFAVYDLEESGLLGSWHHSARLEGPFQIMLSLEMLGYTDRRPGGQRLPPQLTGLYPDVGDFIAVIGNEASRPFLAAVAAALGTVPGLPVEALAVPGAGEALPDTRRSDHASFWDRGLPALMVTDTSFLRNPHYHRPGDTPDTLDYPFLARVTAGLFRAVEGCGACPRRLASPS